ncbi:MAG TPA: response regulator [Marinagarivorans sp.]
MSKGHILVVEDHPDNQQLVRWILEDEAYDVSCAASAEEGLKMLDERRYDAVLMDITLPGINGCEATKILRGKPQYANLPIFALTAHGLESEKASIMASGVTGLLTKPIDEVALIAHLDNTIHC